MLLIDEELENAKEFMLERDMEAEDDIVLLTPQNVALVEAMIKSDVNFKKAYNSKNGPKGKYIGSSAYWGIKLKEVLLDDINTGDFERIINNFIKAIDNENSTHLNADNHGRDNVKKAICKIDRKKLIEYLKEPKNNNYELIYIIKDAGNNKVNNDKMNEYFSFATKFCHYACYYIFNGQKEADNFSIYDSVMLNNFPKYMKRYKISNNFKIRKCKERDGYKQYIETIDEIICKLNKKISRNGLDHLIWYYHRGM